MSENRTDLQQDNFGNLTKITVEHEETVFHRVDVFVVYQVF